MVIARRQILGHATVVTKFEAEVRKSQRQPGNLLVDVPDFRRVGPQELSAGGHVEEQVAYFDGRSRGAAGGPGGLELFPGHAHLVPFHRLGQPGDDPQFGDRGDAGQGLTPEAHRAYGVEVVLGDDLACGVRHDRETQLLRGHARTVVGHTDELFSAILDGDRDACRPGVDRIVDQLLDHAGRPFDDLASRDLVHQQVGQDPNSTVGIHGGSGHPRRKVRTLSRPRRGTSLRRSSESIIRPPGPIKAGLAIARRKRPAFCGDF